MKWSKKLGDAFLPNQLKNLLMNMKISLKSNGQSNNKIGSTKKSEEPSTSKGIQKDLKSYFPQKADEKFSGAKPNLIENTSHFRTRRRYYQVELTPPPTYLHCIQLL